MKSMMTGLAALMLLFDAGPAMAGADAAGRVTPVELHEYSDMDDLLTAGLGAAGLRSPLPPPFVDAASPTAAELRRRAIWNSWRGIADLAPGGGYGEVYGSLDPVPGREYHALARLPGAKQPHRLMVQLPDAFDPAKRCVVVTASSGSRGIYGAIALAGAWGLPRGCAVAYTDKGAGTGYVDTSEGGGSGLDGRVTAAGETVEFAAARYAGEGIAPIAVKHAHSGDNPEADWGRHLQQAAVFALQVLQQAHPDRGPYTYANTRIIALGLSNGGGAVLRAAELEGDWLDGVVAVSPNIQSGAGGRSLYDYATEAALWMPCALNASAFDGVALARVGGAKSPAGFVRCASLKQAGLVQGDRPETQAEEAHARLRASRWSDEAIATAALSVAFDLWRSIAVTYASAYSRAGPGDMPCGFSFRPMDAKGIEHVATPMERAAWWSDATGIPPGAGVGIRDTKAQAPDAPFAGLDCLRSLSGPGGPVHDAVMKTRAHLPRKSLPVLVLHGIDDGLVPEAFGSAAYVQWSKAAGRDVRYWRVRNAQHFDAFLGLPAWSGRYVPMLPYAYRAMDAMWQRVAEDKPLPGDATIEATPRKTVGATVAPLSLADLGKLP